jgi:5'-nucleotidase
LATALSALLLASSAGCLKETETTPVEGHDVKVTFIHTADWHSRLLPYAMKVAVTDESLGLLTKRDSLTSVGGAARAATVINQIRAAGGRIVHLDTGDVFQGAPIFNEFAGEVEFKAYSLLGVDAMVVGNHEFDMGIDNLVKQAKQYAKFALLNANYGLEDPSFPGASKLAEIAKPYVILNKNGFKIGVIGLGSLSSIVSLYYGGNSLGATPLETVEITQFYVDFLRPQVDIVVVASHLGLRGQKQMTRGDEIDLEQPLEFEEGCPIIERLVGDEGLIRYTTGIDIVFGGHLHIVLDPPEVIEDCNPDPACVVSPHAKHIVENLWQQGCYCYPQGHPRHDPDCVPQKRRVPLVHSGAFLKYVGQFNAVFNEPDPPAPPAVNCEANPQSAECKAYTQEVKQWGLNNWELKAYRYMLHPIDERIPEEEFDPKMQRLLQPYTWDLYRHIRLGRIIAFAPKKLRRFSLAHGDSQLGDIVATAMQTRNRVEAHFGLTNTLGIRADFEAGPITVDMMYNVFPFENTITTMTLSGSEVLDLMDYNALRSTRRGCQTQAQVAGITSVINCKETTSDPYGERALRVTIGGSRLSDPGVYGMDDTGPLCEFDGFGACTPASEQVCVDLARCAGEIQGPCPSPAPAQPNPPCCDWRLEPMLPCPAGNEPGDGTCCPVGEICTPIGCGTPVSDYASYKLAANDYIARGGSGFTVLEHNTTQFDTGVSLRDAVIDYVFTRFPPCGHNPDYYDLCTDEMTTYFLGDCTFLETNSAEMANCEARAEARAFDLCDEIPCVDVEADGRIERIFPTK